MRRIAIAAVLVFAAGVVVRGQTKSSSSKTIGGALNVYVFPSDGQSESQQSKDEGACYSWAMKETDVDPFQLSKEAEEQRRRAEASKAEASAATEGSGLRGAAKGAAGGALFGAIAGSPGTGAAIGAAAGFLFGRGQAKHVESRTEEQANARTAKTQKYTAEQMDAFKKAFSVCLEGKRYTVKY